MTNSGDAAEQVVRLSVEGFEVAARLTKRNNCICDEELTAMQPLSKPSRYCASPERAISSFNVKLVIGASVFGLFGISQKFRQI